MSRVGMSLGILNRCGNTIIARVRRDKFKGAGLYIRGGLLS